MDGLVAVGVPLALAIRVVSVVATLMLVRHARACRWVALGASIAASVVTAAVAVHVIASGGQRVDDGTLFAMRRPRRCSVLGDTVVGVVSHDVESHRAPRRALQPVFRPRRRPGPHGRRRRRIQCDGRRLEVVFVADGVIAFLCGWEVMTWQRRPWSRRNTSPARAAGPHISSWSCHTLEPAVSWRVS